MGTKKIGNKSHSTKRTTIMLACSEHGELPYIIRQSCYYLMLLAFNIGGGERAPFPSLCSVVRLSVSRQSPCPHVHGVRHKHGMSHQYSHRQRSCYGYRHGFACLSVGKVRVHMCTVSDTNMECHTNIATDSGPVTDTGMENTY